MKGFQPFPMARGKYGRLVYLDALAARPRKPKTLLCGWLESSTRVIWLSYPVVQSGGLVSYC